MAVTQEQINAFNAEVDRGNYQAAGQMAAAAGVAASDVAAYLNETRGGNLTAADVSQYMPSGRKQPPPPVPKTPVPRIASAPLGSREEYIAELLGLIRGTYGSAMPSYFPGATYVPPSEQTLESLAQQEALAQSMAPLIQNAQKAYESSLAQLQQTAGGQFLQGSPYQQAMVDAATRPITQQFGEQVLPGISSQFSAAGRYGSGAMERAQERATEGYGRALGDVTASIVAQDYGRERQFQEAAMRDVGTLAGRAPQFFAASFLPSAALAQVGAQREAIAAQPLQDEIARFQFQQNMPFAQLANYAALIQGVPMPAQQLQGNTALQNIGAGLNVLGAIPSAVGGVRSLGSFVSGLLS
jgi:hypothetical protein